MQKWQQRLTAAERKHLRDEAGVSTLAGMRRNFEGHQKMREQEPRLELDPCLTCKGIARKLGWME